MTPVQQRIIKWLAGSGTGVSSKTMALWIGFGVMPDDYGHPYDPDDLDRCLRLLDTVPEMRADICRMAEVSPSWAALVESWDEIERSHLDEVGLGWTKARRATRTYNLMKRVLNLATEGGDGR